MASSSQNINQPPKYTAADVTLASNGKVVTTFPFLEKSGRLLSFHIAHLLTPEEDDWDIARWVCAACKEIIKANKRSSGQGRILLTDPGAAGPNLAGTPLRSRPRSHHVAGELGIIKWEVPPAQAGYSGSRRVAYFGVTQKIQHFPQLISQWISLWDRFAVNIDQQAVNVLTTCFDDPNDNGGENDDGDNERDELGDAKQIKEGPNNQNNTWFAFVLSTIG
ncbi:hypothetical protein C8J56DRAFT_1032796 [Mycena floridula]|nr:hypothetical protein C8J56DRAFT_1032796 [Mycena floridula]